MKITVVHGGTSSESHISSKNAFYICKALKENGHDSNLLEFDENIAENLKKYSPDIVFIAVQGKHHGDGTVQAICEHLNLKYTGSKATAAAVINDKRICKEIALYHNIRTPQFIYISKSEFFSVSDSNSKKEIMKRISNAVTYPAVAKAVTQGGSYGIEYISSEDDYNKIAAVFDYDDEIIIERYIKGDFITASVLEINGKAIALPVLAGKNLPDETGELTLISKVYTSETADISDALRKECNRTSLEIFKIFNARSYARIDYMLEKATGLLYFLEINAIPGMKPDSLYPNALRLGGRKFNDAVEIIVQNERREKTGEKL